MWWKMMATQFCTVTKGTGGVNPIFLVLIPMLIISDFSSTGNYCIMQYIELLLDIVIIAIPIYFSPGEFPRL